MSDWSSDVCSSDLADLHHVAAHVFQHALSRLQWAALAALVLDALCVEKPLGPVAGQDEADFRHRRPGHLIHADRVDLRQHDADHAAGGVQQRPAAVALAHVTSHENRRAARRLAFRSEEHTSELQSLMRTSYAAFCLIKKN